MALSHDPHEPPILCFPVPFFFFFNYFLLRWVFIAVHGLSLIVASGE